MRSLLVLLAFLAFQLPSYSCSWSWPSFCTTINSYQDAGTNFVIVSGIVTAADEDGVDLEVLEVLAGTENRSTIRIWDGTDFDCNGLHSMAAADFLRLNNRVVVLLPVIDVIENSWDQIGDYRMPSPWGSSPILSVVADEVTGFIVGQTYSDNIITELPYDIFINEFLGSGICDLDLPNLNVRFFYDENLDGRRDFQENYLPVGAVDVPNFGVFENFKQSGLSLFAPLGMTTFTFEESLVEDWTTSVKSSFEVLVEGDRSYTINIGLTPTRDFSDLTFDISHDRFRCGEEVPFLLTATNEGTTTTAGTFWLEIDPRITAYVFDEEPDYIDQVAGIYGWDYEDLGPYETFVVPLTVTAPLIDDPDQVNEIYIFKITDEENNFKDAAYCQEIELRCAYDPNDKQAFPVRDDKLALRDVPLRYTIRFQNTGNDYAKNVVVEDTLDQNLDLSTFKLVSTSHPRNLIISSTAGYDKRFEFANIFLPDSISDEPNSHGYITYIISAKSDITEETQIDNEASIYFDFNPPILTNTVSRIMVDSFPTSSTLDILSLDIQLTPNPATDEITLNQQVDELRLYDLSGRLVKLGLQTDRMDIEELDEGMYVAQLRKGKVQVTQKLVVIE